jgi:hypothetical protein
MLLFTIHTSLAAFEAIFKVFKWRGREIKRKKEKENRKKEKERN